MKSKVVAEALAMITTAFGLVAALAWNEAVKALVAAVVPQGQGVLSLFVYAIAVTAVVVIITARLVKIKSRFEDEDKKNKGEQQE